MASNVDEPALALAYHFRPDDAVTLLVGPEEHKMLVHGPQITAHSEFFTAALNKEWVEGQTREIKLPEDDPELMTYHIDHVYSNRLPTDVYTTGSPGFRKKAGYKKLAQLYVLAKRLLDSRCRNRIIQEMLRLRALICATGYPSNPSLDSVNIIYQGTTPGSPARRLLIDMYAYTARGRRYQRDADVDPAFLMDLVRKFSGTRTFIGLALAPGDYLV